MVQIIGSQDLRGRTGRYADSDVMSDDGRSVADRVVRDVVAISFDASTETVRVGGSTKAGAGLCNHSNK